MTKRHKSSICSVNRDWVCYEEWESYGLEISTSVVALDLGIGIGLGIEPVTYHHSLQPLRKIVIF